MVKCNVTNGAPDVNKKKILTNTERITYIKISCQSCNTRHYNTLKFWAYPEWVNYNVILTVNAKII